MEPLPSIFPSLWTLAPPGPQAQVQLGKNSTQLLGGVAGYSGKGTLAILELLENFDSQEKAWL